MNQRRTTKQAIRLFMIVTLVILPLLATAPPAHAEGTWTSFLPLGRRLHAMAYLGGDQVLLFGGWDGSNWLGDTWVYDLGNNTWTNPAPTGAPPARRKTAMTPLGEDQVLLFGGEDADWNPYGDTWVYDLSANTWMNQAPAAGPSARRNHAMAYLGADQVLLFGGVNAGGFSGETWVYDLSDNTWTRQYPAVAPSARADHGMAYIGGDQVLLFGGAYGCCTFYSDTWLYDLSDNTWTIQPSAPPARCNHAMAYLGGDQVLLFGGTDSTYPDFGDTWVYDLSDHSWTENAPAAAPSARAGHAMASVGGDQVLLFGGTGGGDETWVYDLSDNIWMNQTRAPSARDSHAMAYIAGDQVLLFGGIDDSGLNGETWVCDLSANTWTNQGPAAAAANGTALYDGPSARYDHAMAYLGGDQVLLFGGSDGVDYLGDTWVYDLSANTWTPMGKAPAAAPSARRGHAMASLGGDQVLLFGGSDADGYDSETWVYDLSANTWTNQAPAAGPSARANHAMTSLGGDQVLLFGGYCEGYGPNDETWVYDLNANTWTSQDPPTGPSARYCHAMASLSGDRVLLFGGAEYHNGETWIYDLSNNSWTKQAPAAAPSGRDRHAMASVDAHQVLLFGGSDGYSHNGETWLATGFYSGIWYRAYLPVVIK